MTNVVKSSKYSLNILRIILIALLVTLVLIIVYLTDGTKNVYLHTIYIPIIVSAYYWGLKGGATVAIISGILAGPFMPLSISEGIMQSNYNWTVRILILTFIGTITGHIFNKVTVLNEKARESDFLSPFTGIYNTNKLIFKLKNMIGDEKHFAIVTIKFTNLKDLEKYIDYRFSEKVIKDLITTLLDEYGKDSVYSASSDEVILLTDLGYQYVKKCEIIINRYRSAISIDQFTLRVSLKMGIFEYRGGEESPIEVLNKARIAYDQGSALESGMYYYMETLDDQRKEFLEISSSLIEAINKNELYLVYQPKIDISNQSISGVEALIRWNRGDKKPVGPNVFIKIAEEIGFIKEISKFVVDNTSCQIIDWKSKGIVLNVAMNLSPIELLDDEFIDWAKNTLEGRMLDKSMCEIEITERVVSSSEELLNRLARFRMLGYKVSIDDFGTGINSLVRMMEIPFDLLKIDKYFIDRIDRLEIKELVRVIINYTHEFNKKVVAEGVETKEQLDILRELNCDKVQGYYYSKPLLPHEFEEYYFEFNKTARC